MRDPAGEREAGDDQEPLVGLRERRDGKARLGGLRTSWHPLGRYREALDEAGDAGRLGLVKVGFDLTGETSTEGHHA